MEAEEDKHRLEDLQNVMDLATSSVVTLTQTTRVVDALRSMVDHNFRKIPVVEEDTRKLRGLISATDIVSFLGGGPKHKIVKERFGGELAAAINAGVEEIMETDVVAIEDTKTWPDALELMVENDVGGCPVVDEERRVVGIITERDILKFLAAHTELRGRVNFYMSKNVLTANFDDSIKDIMRTMISRGLRRVPIMNENVFAGLITTREILRYFAQESNNSLMKKTEILEEPINNILKNPNLLTYKETLFCDPSDRIANVSQVMLEKNYGVVLVGDKEEKIEGILTEKDIMRFLHTKIYLPSWRKNSKNSKNQEHSGVRSS